MQNLLDKLIAWGVCTFVFATPLITYVTLNVLTRPDTITVALELPKPKPVVEIYEFRPDEEITDWFPREEDDYAWTDVDEMQYEMLLEELERPTMLVDEIPAHTDDDLLCMAKNIYFEAKNQSLKGQIAVGLVTLNRVRDSAYPDSVCEVVYDHMQFSWYWDGLPDRPISQEAYDQAELIASALLDPNSIIEDFTYGSDHYHADYVNPTWIEGNELHAMVYVVKIETHIFYRQERRDTSL